MKVDMWQAVCVEYEKQGYLPGKSKTDKYCKLASDVWSCSYLFFDSSNFMCNDKSPEYPVKARVRFRLNLG